jgi:hypothetical protein
MTNRPRRLQFIDSISPSPDGTTRPSVFGPYAERLRTDVFRFLVIILPTVLHAFQSPADAPSPQPNANGHHATVEASGKDALQQIYSRLPFDFFKHAVESPEFAIGERNGETPKRRTCPLFLYLCYVGSVQARFQFAKSVIAMRKKGFGRDAEGTLSTSARPRRSYLTHSLRFRNCRFGIRRRRRLRKCGPYYKKVEKAIIMEGDEIEYSRYCHPLALLLFLIPSNSFVLLASSKSILRALSLFNRRSFSLSGPF